jgi:hypothetical protein
LWDSADDPGGADNDSIGFDRIYESMTQSQANTAAHTSIYSFIDGLKNAAPADSAFIDALLAEHNINGTGVYGEGETNASAGNAPLDVLPVYTDIIPDGTPLNICSNNQYDGANFDGNKLSEYRFLRMAVSSASRYDFDIRTDAATLALLPQADDPNDGADQSDPDVEVRLNGQLVAAGRSGEANRETFTSSSVLQPGNYAIDLVEFRHQDSESINGFPARSCFDVTILPSP